VVTPTKLSAKKNESDACKANPCDLSNEDSTAEARCSRYHIDEPMFDAEPAIENSIDNEPPKGKNKKDSSHRTATIVSIRFGSINIRTEGFALTWKRCPEMTQSVRSGVSPWGTEREGHELLTGLSFSLRK
jgi:hypothetical protein